jgi:hypothetical protein
MTRNQERRLLLAALDYADADMACRVTRAMIGTPERAAAIKSRQRAKARLLSAAGQNRKQPELDLREALRA